MPRWPPSGGRVPPCEAAWGPQTRPSLFHAELVTSKPPVTNEQLPHCAEFADRPRDPMLATSLSRGPRPSGRATVAAQQSAESLINDHLVAAGCSLLAQVEGPHRLGWVPTSAAVGRVGRLRVLKARVS